MKYLFFSVSAVLITLSGCSSIVESKTERKQRHRDNNFNISDKIVDIIPEILFGNSLLYIVDDLLIVNEISPKGKKGIHLFDKNTFKYITSTGTIGQGPGEITRAGNIGIDRNNKILWVPDNGKWIMYKFPLDSVLGNRDFRPTIKKKLDKELFIDRFSFLNDSIALGKAVHITSNYSFEMAMSKLNINTNLIERFGYEHPNAVGKKSNSLFAMSIENNLYVNCYFADDLMTICDLEGILKYNVYGPGWYENSRNKNSYFFGVDLFGDKIIASYIGDRKLVVKGNISKGNSPSKFLVFDKDGNYLKTIETGFEFTRFCVDEENKRIIAYFETRENPLGYFEIPM